MLAEAGAVRLVEIFGDGGDAGHDQAAVLDQHGQQAGRVEVEEPLLSLPRLLLDQVTSRPISLSTRRDET